MIKYILLILVLLSCREKKEEVIKPYKLMFMMYGRENDTFSVGSGDTLVFFKQLPHDTVYVHDTIYRTKVKWRTMYVNNGWEVDTSDWDRGIDEIIIDTSISLDRIDSPLLRFQAHLDSSRVITPMNIKSKWMNAVRAKDSTIKQLP